MQFCVFMCVYMYACIIIHEVSHPHGSSKHISKPTAYASGVRYK